MPAAIAPAPQVQTQGDGGGPAHTQELGQIARGHARHLPIQHHQLGAVVRLGGEAPLGVGSEGVDAQCGSGREVGRDRRGESGVEGRAARDRDHAVGIGCELLAGVHPGAALKLLARPGGFERGGEAGGCDGEAKRDEHDPHANAPPRLGMRLPYTRGGAIPSCRAPEQRAYGASSSPRVTASSRACLRACSRI